MKGARVRSSILIAAALAACSGRGPAPQPAPRGALASAAYLPRSHSHNNYAQGRPLFDALERGFASIEADVVLMDGELYVAHAPEEVDRSATLVGLYLDPLREVVRRNGGSVYGPGTPPLQLLVDVKTEPDATYRALHDVLRDYADVLSVWTEARSRPGAVSVVLSGNRAIELIEASRPRFVAIDGRILDDRSALTAAQMPLVSASWEELEPSAGEDRVARARSVVDEMHAEGRRVRFWATPEDEELWRSLVDMGVDYIGTDDPPRLERLLREIDRRRSDSID